jgi:hypothetical protein
MDLYYKADIQQATVKFDYQPPKHSVPLYQLQRLTGFTAACFKATALGDGQR